MQIKRPVKLAKACGCIGVRVAAADEFGPALKWALEQPVPAIVEAPIEWEENLRLTQRLGELVISI